MITRRRQNEIPERDYLREKGRRTNGKGRAGKKVARRKCLRRRRRETAKANFIRQSRDDHGSRVRHHGKLPGHRRDQTGRLGAVLGFFHRTTTGAMVGTGVIIRRDGCALEKLQTGNRLQPAMRRRRQPEEGCQREENIPEMAHGLLIAHDGSLFNLLPKVFQKL